MQQAESLRSSDPPKFQQALLRLNELSAQATPRQQEQLQYLNAYGDAFAGRHQEAIRKARLLVAGTADTDMKYRSGALIVNVYAVTRQFTEGLRQLEQTLAILDQVKDPLVRRFGLWGATVIYNQIGQYKLALQYAERLLREPLPERDRCIAEQGRLEALHALARLPTSDLPINQAIAHCIAQHELAAANFMRITLARKWVGEGKRKEAIQLLASHLDEVEDTHFPRLISEVRALLAELELVEDNLPAAEAHARAALAFGANIANTLPQVSAYKTMYLVSLHKGDDAAALEFYTRYAEADKAYLSDVNARELAYQIVRQETQQKTQEIALLNQQNRVLQLQQQVDRQSAANTRTLMLMLLALTGVIGYWAYRVKRMEQTLRHRAEVDALTGICNRQHFTARAEKTLLDCGRAGEEVALIMFDLDHFKSINDRFGHRAGDWVLQRVAQVCQDLSRQVDCLGRIGGEEFAFLLRGQDVRSATRLADDCRLRLAAIDTGETGFSFPVTASFGVTSTALSGYGLASLFTHADKALYRAKHEGRNRVCVYLPEEVPWQPATLPSVVEPTAQPEPAPGDAHDATPDAQPAPAAGPPHLRIVPK